MIFIMMMLMMTIPFSCSYSLPILRDGTKLLTASAAKDVTIHDFHTEDVDHCFSNAHQDAVYALCVLSDSLFASGDDAGVIKVMGEPRI